MQKGKEISDMQPLLYQIRRVGSRWESPFKWDFMTKRGTWQPEEADLLDEAPVWPFHQAVRKIRMLDRLGVRACLLCTGQVGEAFSQNATGDVILSDHKGLTAEEA
jgi:hypothetical protein